MFYCTLTYSNVFVLSIMSRKLRLESELTSLWWKIRWNEIIFIQTQNDRLLDQAKPLYSNFVSNIPGEQETTPALGKMLDDEHALTSTSFGGDNNNTLPEKSNSAPQSITHNFLARLDKSGKQIAAHSSIATVSQTIGGESRSKPHIRINDYFALPTYLQNFGANRANRLGNFSLKNHCTSGSNVDKCNNSSGTPSKTTLLVQQGSSRGAGNSSNFCSLHGGHHKQISCESLAQIPNKGIYKVECSINIYYICSLKF